MKDLRITMEMKKLRIANEEKCIESMERNIEHLCSHPTGDSQQDEWDLQCYEETIIRSKEIISELSAGMAEAVKR